MRSGKRALFVLVPALILAVFLAGNLHLTTYIYTGVYPAFRFVQGQFIAGRVKDSEPIKTKGFIIHSRPGGDAAAEVLISVAQSYSDDVYKFFDYERSGPVEIMLFENEQELKKALNIPEELSALGAYSGGRINLLRPESLDGSGSDGNQLENVYVHELAHLVLDHICKGNYPLWFTEGSALYVEYLLLGYEWGIDLEYDRAYTIDELAHSFSKLDEQAAYRQSFLLVRNLIEGYGIQRYRSFLRALGSGEPFDTALSRIYSLESQEFANLVQ